MWGLSLQLPLPFLILGALLPLTRTGLLLGLLGCLQMGEVLGLELWVFASPTGTEE